MQVLGFQRSDLVIGPGIGDEQVSLTQSEQIGTMFEFTRAGNDNTRLIKGMAVNPVAGNPLERHEARGTESQVICGLWLHLADRRQCWPILSSICPSGRWRRALLLGRMSIRCPPRKRDPI